MQGQFGSVLTFQTHSCVEPWHCVVNVSAHTGRCVVFVHVAVPRQATPPQCGDTTLALTEPRSASPAPPVDCSALHCTRQDASSPAVASPRTNTTRPIMDVF